MPYNSKKRLLDKSHARDLFSIELDSAMMAFKIGLLLEDDLSPEDEEAFRLIKAQALRLEDEVRAIRLRVEARAQRTKNEK